MEIILNNKFEYWNRDGKIDLEKEKNFLWSDQQRHRTDGPAFIKYNEHGLIIEEQYWLNNTYLRKHVWQFLANNNKEPKKLWPLDFQLIYKVKF